MAWQLPLPLDMPSGPLTLSSTVSYVDRLRALLQENLDFHEQESTYATHNFHAFPAKFPPQLPALFIEYLTNPGDVVLDPMVGSGTTVVEAVLRGRRAIGCDIDPLALLLSSVKVTPCDPDRLAVAARRILAHATVSVSKRRGHLLRALSERFDEKTKEFVDYWFPRDVQIELMALLEAIDREADQATRPFFVLSFSAIIITKSGGVSLARDLAHTRPHRVPEKRVRSPLLEFKKRVSRNIAAIRKLQISSTAFFDSHPGALFHFGDAQQLPLAADSVDLIVTSPPYAANAIDYMRAHKFSLVWFGYSVQDLSKRRGRYIGGESVRAALLEPLPDDVSAIIDSVAERDRKKGLALDRYFSEMYRVLREMRRVLKPRRGAVVVVGTSVMRGIEVPVHKALASIASEIGLEVVGIGVRKLDRDRRMLPVGRHRSPNSQIEQRLHQEYVLGLYKEA